MNFKPIPKEKENVDTFPKNFVVFCLENGRIIKVIQMKYMNGFKGGKIFRMKTLKNVIKTQVVLVISMIAALITCIFVPLDKEYLGYFDMRTLACLYGTLAVIGALKNVHFFEILARQIVLRLHNTRNAILGVVLITLVASMLFTNDMALLSFLPLGFFILDSTNNRKYLAFTFIMQNMAANLGGMITPFGNPQNLYLYSYFQIPTGEFFGIMFLPFVVSAILIIICCMFVKSEKLSLKEESNYQVDYKRIIIYCLLFVCSILIVFRVIPYVIGAVLITIVLLLMDKKAIKEVNYPLLLTFCAFFVFSGNMARIPQVQMFFEKVLPINPLLFGVLCCQVISNVPAAVLLSKFTFDYNTLLVAVNIGGCGTLIASLASLITFSELKKCHPKATKQFMFLFSIFNIGFLAILFIVQTVFG